MILNLINRYKIYKVWRVKRGGEVKTVMINDNITQLTKKLKLNVT